MGPPSYTRSDVDQNVVMQRKTVNVCNAVNKIVF